MMTRHVREAVWNGQAQQVGRLPAQQIMDLNIVLPLRDPAGVKSFLSDLYNPASPSYRHFLTVSQFTERFGPTQQDYDAVVLFAQRNGFTVVGGARDGMDVQITRLTKSSQASTPTILPFKTGFYPQDKFAKTVARLPWSIRF